MQQACEGIAKHYKLDAQQKEQTCKMLTERVTRFLEKHDKAFTSFELAVLFDDQHAAAFRAGAAALRQLERGNLAQEYESRASQIEASQESSTLGAQ